HVVDPTSHDPGTIGEPPEYRKAGTARPHGGAAREGSHNDRVSAPAIAPVADHRDLLEDPILLEGIRAEHLAIESLDCRPAPNRWLALLRQAGPLPFRKETPNCFLVVCRDRHERTSL